MLFLAVFCGFLAENQREHMVEHNREKQYMQSLYDDLKADTERYVAHSDVFTANDVTYEQLKSSGNFRYVRNLALYKAISDYYNRYIRYQSIDGSFGASERRNEMTSIESRIFNPDDLASLDNMSTGDSARVGFYNLSFRS